MKKKLLKLTLYLFIFSAAISCSKDDEPKKTIPNDSVEIVPKVVEIVPKDYAEIGTQKWAKKNLDIITYQNGDPIPQVTDPSQFAGITTGAWCYYGTQSSNGTTYGKLYNWYAVADPRGLAPTGFHIPNDDEWNMLINYLGGEGVAGGKLKNTDPLWETPNEGATNSSGFSALPGGFYDSVTGYFFAAGSVASWWSTTEVDADNASYVGLINNSGTTTSYNDNKHSAYSVRCVKDN